MLDKHFEIEALHRDGRELPVELSITRTEQFGEAVFLGFLRDISERHDAARRQELMIGELNHRVKNLLGVVAGIAHQTVGSSSTLSDFSAAFNGRLSSLGRHMRDLPPRPGSVPRCGRSPPRNHRGCAKRHDALGEASAYA